MLDGGMGARLLIPVVLCAALGAATAQRAGAADPYPSPAQSLRDAIASACTAVGAGPRVRTVRLASGNAVRLSLVRAGARLLRIGAEYLEASGTGAPRPVMTAFADGACRILGGRRIVRGTGGRIDLVILLGDLTTERAREPLEAPVPPGSDPGGVTVAVVDSGVNYTIPAIAERLARDGAGRSLGYDYWDMDPRPFDGDTRRSLFFPIRHGTRVAGILIAEAPAVRLLPYRYPRPDMGRLADLVADAAAKGARIVAMPLGSNERDQWQAFAAAARQQPGMLFVISAGNDGRDIDSAPVYPAALGLANALVVTSSDDVGRLAAGCNWGRRSVDLMTPAENRPTIDHLGRPASGSGSSFAVPRIAALAARLLATHPEWRAAELKRAIIARARRSPLQREAVTRYGWIPYPERDG